LVEGPHCPLVERNLLTSTSFLDFIEFLRFQKGTMKVSFDLDVGFTGKLKEVGRDRRWKV
jgi:hypothetical protein